MEEIVLLAGIAYVVGFIVAVGSLVAIATGVHRVGRAAEDIAGKLYGVHTTLWRMAREMEKRAAISSGEPRRQQSDVLW